MSLVCFAASRPAAGAELQVTVRTDKAQYRQGEALHIRVDAHNPGSSAANLRGPDSSFVQYNIDATGWVPSGFTTEIVPFTVPAGRTLSFPYRYDWSSGESAVPLLVNGIHSVSGRLTAYDQSVLRRFVTEPVSFEVVPAVLPAEPFLIDFDQLPGTHTRPASVTEYWPHGVHFRSAGLRFLDITGPNTVPPVGFDGNAFIDAGRNSVVEFDMPVFGVSARVTANSGITVTLIAKDANGTVLGSDTSAPVSEPGVFTDPLSVRSDVAIKSLEWRTSGSNQPAWVDDLLIDPVAVPEPSAALTLSAGLVLLCRRPNRRRDRQAGA
jgi:hypothetical protein